MHKRALSLGHAGNVAERFGMQPSSALSRLQTAWAPLLNDVMHLSHVLELLAWAGLGFGAHDSRANPLACDKHVIATIKHISYLCIIAAY